MIDFLIIHISLDGLTSFGSHVSLVYFSPFASFVVSIRGPKPKEYRWSNSMLTKLLEIDRVSSFHEAVPYSLFRKPIRSERSGAPP